MKIDKNSFRLLQHLHVGKHDRIMYRQQAFLCFQFYTKDIFYQYIQS